MRQEYSTFRQSVEVHSDREQEQHADGEQFRDTMQYEGTIEQMMIFYLDLSPIGTLAVASFHWRCQHSQPKIQL